LPQSMHALFRAVYGNKDLSVSSHNDYMLACSIAGRVASFSA
jgi:hypothetical protein